MSTRGSDQAAAFFRRARLEAERYGPDAWVFIRELLQNARDAGARRIDFQVDEGEADRPFVRVDCVDDGSGMSLDHARRFLFRLYASSKEGDRRQAGRFGVGFWSVLRFAPDRISVRSRPSVGAGWGLVIDLERQRVVEAEAPRAVGTCVSLERGWTRGVPDGHLHRRVLDAVRQNGRFLRAPDGHPIEILVDGEAAHADFSLPPPCIRFSRARMRGIVALGPAAQIELFSRGLRVRSAAALDDLLARRDAGTRTRVAFPELPEGLAPQALLDSDDLQVLLARADARDDRALRRLVGVARRELVRLVNRQLARYRRLGALEWLRHALASAWRSFGGPFPAAVALTAIALGVGAVVGLRAGERARPSPPATEPRAAPGSEAGAARTASPARPAPYRDIGASYRGPDVDELAAPEGASPPLDIRYAPADARPRLAALAFERTGPDGGPAPAGRPGALAANPARCGRGCLSVDLAFESPGGLLRLPVPTGHAVVDNELRFVPEARGAPGGPGEPPAARSVRVVAELAGLPAVAFPGPAAGRLRYLTVPAPGPARPPPGASVALPDELEAEIRAALPLPTFELVRHLVRVVQRRVIYDRSAAVAARHRGDRARGVGLLERTVRIGAGDCDVINALLFALLQRARVPSRLVIGYLGLAGRVRPIPHAWVEFQDDDRAWRAADATAPAGPGVDLPEAAPGASAGDPAARVAPPSAEPAPSGRDDPVAVAGPPEPDRPPRDEPPRGAAPAAEPVEALAGAGEPEPGASPPPLAARPPEAPNADDAPPITARPPRGALVAAAGVLGFIVLARLWRGRGRRAVRLDDSGDVSRLLQGALKQPKAFRDMPTVFERRLVPLTSGGLISLREASALNRAGRLYAARGRGPLERGGRARRAAVIDAEAAAGRVVATALAAIDLDRWDELLARAAAEGPCAAANRILEDSGEAWRVLVADGVGDDAAVLDVAPLGGYEREGVGRAGRLVVVDRTSPTWFLARAAEERAPGADPDGPGGPAEAALALVDQLAVRLRVPTARRSRLLAVGARAALGVPARPRGRSLDSTSPGAP